jgi:hypothetical protein
MKKNKQSIIQSIASALCAICVGTAANCLAAPNFGVHFLGATTDPVTGTAGVVPIADWNNIANTFTTGSITGDDGVTTATLTMSGAYPGDGGWLSGLTGDGANYSLMDGYVDAGANNGPAPHTVTNTISGLGAGNYDVYIYNYSDSSHPGNGGDYLADYQINGITYAAPQLGNGTSTYTTDGSTVGGPFSGFVQATTSPANYNGIPPNATNFGNYFKVASVATTSGGTITIVVEADGLSWRSPFNGFELIPASGAAPTPGLPTSSPSSATVAPGGVVTLSAFAAGSGPLTYQWQTDGGTGGALTPVSGATSSNLVVNTTGFAPGTYAYNFLVGNSFGTNASVDIYVTVAAPYFSPAPAIGVQFEGNGNSKVLTPLQLAGYVPIEFWNVDNLASGGTASNFVDYAGAPSALTVSATYQNGTWYTGTGNLSPLTPDDILMSGGFWSGSGFVIGATNVPYSSYNVYVYILNDNNPNRRYALSINGTQTNYGSVFNGNTQTGYPPYTFDVQRTQLPNGVQANADLVVFTNVAGSSFQINAATPDGTVAIEAIEIVNAFVGQAVAGQISVSPAGQIFTGLQTVLQENTLSGALPLTYQWYTDGGTGGALSPISGANGPTYSVNTAILTAGNYQYQVAVTNSQGGSISPIQTVNITTSEPFIANDISVTPTNEVYVGEPVTLSANFVGTTPITLQWLKDAGTGSGPQPVSGATNSTLVLNNPKASDSGTYSLSANNSVGGPVLSSSSLLTVVPNLLPPASSYAYGAQVLAYGPLAYWPLNDTNDPSTGGSPAYDASGNGYYGAYGVFAENGFDGVTGPQAPQFPGFPNVNGALESLFGNESTYVSTSLGTAVASNITYIAWINPSGPQAAWNGIMFDRGGPGVGFNFGGVQDGTGMSELGYTWISTNDANTYNWNSYLYPTANQWSFVALTLTPTGATIYLVNQAGVVQSTNQVLPETASEFGVSLHIGNDGIFGDNGTRTFNGSISSAAIFLTALSSNQIITLGDVGLGITPPTPPNVTLNISKSTSTPGSLTLNWSQGTLLQATNVTGPWTTNGNLSPYTVDPTNAYLFFRVRVQ